MAKEWKCKSGCSQCCGIVPIDRWICKIHEGKQQRKVVEIIGDKNGEVYPFTEDGKCVFLTPDNRCAIYDDRPDVCRQYGQCDELPCPYIKKNGNPRSPAQVRRIQRQINHDVDARMKRLGKIAGAD